MKDFSLRVESLPTGPPMEDEYVCALDPGPGAAGAGGAAYAVGGGGGGVEPVSGRDGAFSNVISPP